MQRRIRQKHAKVAITRRNSLDDRNGMLLRQKYDWPLHRLEDSLSRVIYFAEFGRCFQAMNHDGEWLFCSTLAVTENSQGICVGCIHRDVKTSQTLNCNNRSGLEPRHCLDNWIAALN